MSAPKVTKIDLTKLENILPKKRSRNLIIRIVILFLFVAILIYSFNVQIIKSPDYLTKASLLDVHEDYIQPQRGIIYDSTGVPLVKNEPSFDVYLKKTDYSDDDYAAIKSSLIKMNIADKDADDLVKQIQDSKYDIKVKLNLNSDEANSIRADLGSYFYLTSALKRVYLDPGPYSHIVGYVGSADVEDVKNGYQPTDEVGKYKLESQYETQLKGIPGKKINLGGVDTVEESEPGDNIYLTINSVWQDYLYTIVGQEEQYWQTAGGAGVVVDDSNGNIMAMVSFPGFDPNSFVNGISADQYNNYLTSREKPLLDKALGLQAAPGSSFKIITAYTLLQNHIIDENTTYYSNRCIDQPNFNFCEYHQLFYGQMNVVRALTKSSNLFFCNNMLNLAHAGELKDFSDAATLFNIGKPTGIDLVGEASGNMDSPAYRKAALNLDWYDGDTCNAAIGQGSVLVTPLQMAMVASTVANKGVYYTPHVISKITDSNGNVIHQTQPDIQRTIPFDQKTLDLINEGMYDVANNWEGTVYPFLHDVPGNIRAKTGTAEAYENLDGQEIYRTHGWIVGTFDYSGKSYSFAIQLNYGGGGYYIAKTVRKFVNCVYSNFQDGCLAW